MLILVAIAIIVVVGAVALSRAGAKDMSSVSPADARELIGSPGSVILDVRSAEEYRGGHIEHALLIPLPELEGRLSELEVHRDKLMLVYCRSGQRSAAACRILTARGFAKTRNLSGGCMAWKDSGFPLVT